MSDEQQAIVSAELPTPAANEPAVELTNEEYRELPKDVGDETVSEHGDNDDGGDPAAALEPEFVTLERNGKQYQVPKDLEGEFLMQGDYTKKTQTVAEKAKELEQREAALTQQAEASDEELNLRASLKTMDKTLAEYAKLSKEDWAAHRNADYIGTEEAWREYQDLKVERENAARDLEGKQNERTEVAQQDLAKRVQETLEAANKLPGVTADNRSATIEKLVSFATSEGIPEQVLKANWSPTLLALLHKAQIGAEFIAKQSAARPGPPKPQIAPLAVVKASVAPAATRTLADLANGDDMEAYAAARAAGKKR